MWKSQSTITIPWKGNAEVTVTELLSTTLDVARSVLIDVAKSGKKITYGELAQSVQEPDIQRSRWAKCWTCSAWTAATEVSRHWHPSW